MLQMVSPAAWKRSMRPRSSASSHGILGPPISTESTPICFNRRMPAASVLAPAPRQIFGVSRPFGRHPLEGGLRRRGRGGGRRHDGSSAAPPSNCSNCRRGSGSAG